MQVKGFMLLSQPKPAKQRPAKPFANFLFIQERINMLLAALNKTRPEKNERIIQAECFIKNLPDAERKLVENYIEQFTDWLADKVRTCIGRGFWMVPGLWVCWGNCKLKTPSQND